MYMNVTIDQVQKILNGNFAFSQLGFSLFITQWKGIYKRNPSETTLQACTDEANAFLQKYAVIMSDDYEVISQI